MLTVNYIDLRVLLPLLTLAAERAVGVTYEPDVQCEISLRSSDRELKVIRAPSLGEAVREAVKFLETNHYGPAAEGSLGPRRRADGRAFGHDFSACRCSECKRLAASWDEYNERRQ